MDFVDLKLQQTRIRKSLESRIAKVLDHGQYILGPEVRELEQKLASLVGVEHCLGVASGTDALLMGLMAADIGPGDAVFTTPFPFVATVETIRLLGATPLFADIDERTFNVDSASLAVDFVAASIFVIARVRCRRGRLSQAICSASMPITRGSSHYVSSMGCFFSRMQRRPLGRPVADAERAASATSEPPASSRRNHSVVTVMAARCSPTPKSLLVCSTPFGFTVRASTSTTM